MKKIFLNYSWIVLTILLACLMTSCGKTYTVTYMDESVVLKTVEVKKGDSASEYIPEKEGYIFEGWSESVENVKSDIVTYAQFTKKMYTVKFYVNGNLFDTKTCYHNESVSSPARPDVEGYLFRGWDGSYKNVTSDLEIHARMD